MPPPWIVESVDILEQRQFALPSGVPWLPPDQFSLHSFEEGLDNGVIPTIALTAQRDLEAVFFQRLLVLMRTVLASTVRMMDATFGRLT